MDDERSRAIAEQLHQDREEAAWSDRHEGKLADRPGTGGWANGATVPHFEILRYIGRADDEQMQPRVARPAMRRTGQERRVEPTGVELKNSWVIM